MSNKKELEKPKINFKFDLSKCNFQIDSLQGKMLEFYLRADRRFRMAFNMNYTNEFLQFLKDKAILGEPFHLSIMGVTRSGKSSIASTIGFIHSKLYNREFNVDYICGNSIEFLEKIKVMPEKQTRDSYFQIDEEKNFFGVGSMAKKMKIQDVANIIAKHNISTASLCPTGFSNKDSHYGLRIFGKDLKNMVCRMMLYNLQEGNSGRAGGLPMGNIYLPIPKAFLPSETYKEFNTEYEAKKDRWIKKEIMGEGDVLAKVKKDTAIKLNSDKKFLQLRTKKDRTTYITQVLGSEWSVGEISEIENLSKLLYEGIL